MAQMNEKVLHMKSKISIIKEEIKRKQVLLQKWEKSLAQKRKRSYPAKPPNAEGSTTNLNSEMDNQIPEETTADVSQREDKGLEALEIEIPSPSPELNDEEIAEKHKTISDGLLMVTNDPSNKRRSQRIKPTRDYSQVKRRARRKLNHSKNVSISPISKLSPDIDKSSELSKSELSNSEDKKSQAESPALYGGDFDRCPDSVATAMASPVWTLNSLEVEPIEMVRLYSDDQGYTLVTCQRSRISIWTKADTENSWNSHRLQTLKIIKDDVYRFDVIRIKEKIGVFFVSKFNTTMRISLFTFPEHSSTEKITTVSEKTDLIFGCQCGDELYQAYGFVDGYSTAIEIWRTDAALTRLIRGRAVSTIGQAIHSLCPLINAKGILFVGIAPVTLYIWNAVLGSLVMTIDLEESFISMKSCGFASFEKGLLFLGALNAAEQMEGQIVVINPKTAKFKILVSWDEDVAEKIFLCDEYSTTSMVSTISEKRICLRDVDGSLVAKASLSPSCAYSLSAIHLSYCFYNRTHTMAVGNTAGTVIIYNLMI